MDVKECKKEFSKNEILWLVFQGALNMGYPYLVYKQDQGVTSKDRAIFKRYLGEKLEECVKNIHGTLSDEEYIKILETLEKDIATSSHKRILNYDKLMFGRIQKLLNLYLKYLWVFNQQEYQEEPPHCPIDRIILEKIDWPYHPDIEWTMPTFTAQKYQEAIDLCRIKAQEQGFGDNISAWELCVFNDRNQIDGEQD